MNASRRRACAVVAAWIAVTLGSSCARNAVAQKSPQTAGEFYITFAAAVEKAKSLDELQPLLQKDAAEMLGKMPKEMHSEIMQQIKGNAVTAVKVLKESPFESGFLVEMEATKKADGKRAKGWAQIAKENGAFKFVNDDWTGAPPPAPAQPPKIPASVAEVGKASGEWTVNGQKALLNFAFAEATPDSFDPKQTGYKLVLSDVVWNPDDYKHDDKVTAGTLHYVELSLGHEKRVYGTMLYHRAFKDMTYLSSAGGDLQFEPEVFGPDVLAGKVYMKAPEDSMGGNRYFAATFRAPVRKRK